MHKNLLQTIFAIPAGHIRDRQIHAMNSLASGLEYSEQTKSIYFI